MKFNPFGAEISQRMLFGSKAKVLKLGVLPILFFLSSCLSDDLSLVSEVQQDFQGVTKVEVDGGFLEVEYIGESGRQSLSLDIALRSNSSRKFEVDYNLVGSTLKVSLVSNNRLFSGSARGDGLIRITGPRNMLLDLEVGSGKITAKNVVATSANLRAGSGEIVAQNLAVPRLEVDITSGKGRLEDILGGIDATLTSGKIEMLRLEGDVQVQSSSGEVFVKDLNGLFDAIASSGKIELANVKGIGNIAVSSGQLFATNSGLSPQTTLKASSGNMYIQTFSNLRDFNFNITTGSGSAKVGEAQSTGALNINNGASTTIRGEVGSGRIEIVN